MEKLKMHTTDFVDQNIEKIAKLFPHCVTEIKTTEHTENTEKENNNSVLSVCSVVKKEFEVFFVDDNALAACFVKDGEITEDFCKELAGRQPLRVVFRDSGFKDDSVKINVEQIFKLMSPHTEVKTI